ncbi:hypothetical protein OROGR_018338 [Orobanche gracilis]
MLESSHCLLPLYGSRWNIGFKLESVGARVLVLYRDQLDNMKDDQVLHFLG